jgi:MoxR-like ATPase
MQPEIVAFQICVQIREPVHFWGESGIGKTAVTQAIAAARRESYWPVIMSIREPSDQAGLPVVDHEDKSVWMAPPRWAKKLVEEGKGIVHFDELNVAAPTVQNSGLRIVNEGWAGDEKLPDETSFVACGNPPETNPGVYALTPAMANRFVHIEFPLDHEEWCDAMAAGFPPPSVIHVPDRWRDLIQQMRGLISQFIRLNSAHLHNKPQDTHEAGRAWPSPRQWDATARVMAAAVSVGENLSESEMRQIEDKDEDGEKKVVKFKTLKSRVVRILVEGCVGWAAARAFFSWLVNQDLRDPEEYLANPHGTPLPQRQDQLTTTMTSVVSAALSRKYKGKEFDHRYRQAWEVIARVAFELGAADVCIIPASILARNITPTVAKDMPACCEKLFPMIEESGIDLSKNDHFSAIATASAPNTDA